MLYEEEGKGMAIHPGGCNCITRPDQLPTKTASTLYIITFVCYSCIKTDFSHWSKDKESHATYHSLLLFNQESVAETSRFRLTVSVYSAPSQPTSQQQYEDSYLLVAFTVYILGYPQVIVLTG